MKWDRRSFFVVCQPAAAPLLAAVLLAAILLTARVRPTTYAVGKGHA